MGGNRKMFWNKKPQVEDKVFSEIKKLLEILEVKVAKIQAETDLINLKLRKKMFSTPKEEENVIEEDAGLLTSDGKPYKYKRSN